MPIARAVSACTVHMNSLVGTWVQLAHLRGSVDEDCPMVLNQRQNVGDSVCPGGKVYSLAGIHTLSR